MLAWRIAVPGKNSEPRCCANLIVISLKKIQCVILSQIYYGVVDKQGLIYVFAPGSSSCLFFFPICRKQKTSLNISWQLIYKLLLKVVPFPSASTNSAFNGRVVEKYPVSQANIGHKRSVRMNFMNLSVVLDKLRSKNNPISFFLHMDLFYAWTLIW